MCSIDLVWLELESVFGKRRLTDELLSADVRRSKATRSVLCSEAKRRTSFRDLQPSSGRRAEPCTTTITVSIHVLATIMLVGAPEHNANGRAATVPVEPED
jgi:hypothetical protein